MSRVLTVRPREVHQAVIALSSTLSDDYESTLFVRNVAQSTEEQPSQRSTAINRAVIPLTCTTALLLPHLAWF